MHQMAMRVDDFGKPAWIALMVIGFIVFWPIGLAILAYMIWSGRMGCGQRAGFSRWNRGEWKHRGAPWMRSSGNTAFDEYRNETLKRLEDEQREFKDFLYRLRHAKDKAEFDQFMNERRNNPNPSSSAPPPSAAPPSCSLRSASKSARVGLAVVAILASFTFATGHRFYRGLSPYRRDCRIRAKRAVSPPGRMPRRRSLRARAVRDGRALRREGRKTQAKAPVRLTQNAGRKAVTFVCPAAVFRAFAQTRL
mgnify:CR=1 FL=1